MRVSFLTSGYMWVPSGGRRILYEYANRLVSRGHEVSVIHPRRLIHSYSGARLSGYRAIRKKMVDLYSLFQTPSISWHAMNPRVNLLFVPDSDARHVPDADAIFASSWDTVEPLLGYPASKGEKCYLIQGYETFMGPKDLVDATWRAPLQKVVIAKWLIEKGKELGCEDLTYIPNAIDHNQFRLLRPIEGRSPRVAMLASPAPFKGTADGIAALNIVKQKYPGLRAVLFGTKPRLGSISGWIEYHRNPPQEFLVENIYNGSSIFLAPSWTEGSPLPPAEAACCGCALVATDIGGFREYIQPGVTGLLSPAKKPVGLAENLDRLLTSDQYRLTLANAARDAVHRIHWESSTDLLESFVTRVVQSSESHAVTV